MIKHDALMAACQQIDDAALTGSGWPEALEALSDAAGSRGVVVMHNRDRRLVACVANESIREPVEAYLAGKAPPNSRQTRVRHDFDDGFRIDYDDYKSRTIAYDPFYQDYLRPIGMQWHANARLKMTGTDEIAVSFKRELKHGSYDAADKETLDRILPRLRTAALMTEYVFDAETRGMVRALHRRGRPVLEFDAWGRVRRQHGAFEAGEGPLAVIGGRAVAAEPEAQEALEKAIGRSVRPPQRQASVLLHDMAGARHLLQIVPITGRARDVFFASSAIGMVIGRPTPASFAPDLAAADLFRFTVREAQIAGLLCEGRSTTEIAARLVISADTVRFHLKAVFEKTGARRRSEVVAMIARMAS